MEVETGTETCHVALVGNPNVGKTSVFNILTGLKQSVGNFPGVTVDKKLGSFHWKNVDVKVIDLPGLYSLFPTSEDERVVINVLMKDVQTQPIDVIGCIVNANDLERNLLLFTQIRDLGYSLVVGVNMVDTSAKNGLKIDYQGLTESFGVPFIPINGRIGKGIDEFKDALLNQASAKPLPAFYTLSEQEHQIARDIQSLIPTDSEYAALLLAHHHKRIQHLTEEQKEYISKLVQAYQFNSLDIQLDEMMKRYQKIAPLLQKSIQYGLPERDGITKKIDQILTHPVLGLVIFILLMFVVFQSIFTWSEQPMEWVEKGFSLLSVGIEKILPESWFRDLLTEGIVSGLSGVLVFVPQIAILFFLISILEESGYMARVVYMMDSLMRRFGLNGRSVVSLISGGACAIPAIMSTRTINNWKERLITIMVTPLISCSARIPVFTILIAIAIPPKKILGWISLQAVVFMGLYVLGALTALVIAWIFNKILKTGEKSFLMIELPRYQMPHWRNVFLNVFEKIKLFTFEVGKVILIVSVFLWFLASYGPESQMRAAEKQARTEYQISQDIPLNQLVQMHQLEASYAGNIGRFIEPVIRPLGFDWKIGIALISSFVAREVFVGTMATLYAVEDGNNDMLIVDRLQSAVNRQTGEKVFSLGTAVALMIFYLYSMQCVSTIAVVRRETKSWKWPAIQVLYMGVLAYVGSFIAAHIF